MKILLVGINAKYIHSNIGIYSLKAYAEKYAYAFCNGENRQGAGKCASAETSVEIVEYTINQQKGDIIKNVYEHNPDVICMSCYIWNIEIVKDIISDISNIMPNIHIWLGGPEVSYNIKKVFSDIIGIKGIMQGEGEETFSQLVDIYAFERENVDDRLKDTRGIAYIKEKCRTKINDNSDISEYIVDNGMAPPLDFSKVPFPYFDIQDFKHRIVYYETSRGCPFGCAYCLSSVDKKLRFRNLMQVKEELKFFVDSDVPQVKFIDRTFNCDHRRSVEILQFIKENDNGKINFHFEIAGDILTDEEINIIRGLRPGLIQLEIGVQSTNCNTLEAINRKTDLNLLKRNVALLRENNNVHLHLDLIAGLPFEDIESFRQSFNDVYNMNGHELQLGFLKMLQGAPINDIVDEHNIVTSKKAPYEVLSTRYLSYGDMIELKAVEEMLEIYHNSGQFINTESFLLKYENTPYDFYYKLAMFYKKKCYSIMQSSRAKRYEYLLEYALEQNIGDCRNYEEKIRELLTLDYYLRENAKSRPVFSLDESNMVSHRKEFYRNSENIEKYLSNYSGYDAKQISRMTHLECFNYIDEKGWYLFDYADVNPVSNNVNIKNVTK